MLKVLAVIALLAVAAKAQDLPKPPPPTTAPASALKVGSDAPPLSIAKWVKGEPVAFEKGRIYVVAFWATGDEDGVAYLPQLSLLQETHKDKVTIVAVAAQDDPGNSLEDVEAMVKDKGPGMGFSVAWDDEGKTRAAWLAAAGVNRTPCAFLVDGNGKIAFFHNPLLLDFPLYRLVAGKWDAAKGPEEMQAAFKRAAEILQMDRSMALSALPAFEKDYPELLWTRAIASRGQMSFLTSKLRLLLLAGKSAEATALGTSLLENGVKFNDPLILNLVSWLIVDPEMAIASRDLDLAMKAAEKAVELTKGEEGAILDTLARVHYWKGDLKKAIEIQTKAVEKAQGDAEMLASLQETLEQYNSEAAAK